MRTSISESFRDGTVLVTGSTGFLGKILTEKLLRLSHVKHIVVLVRKKNELDAHQRVADILKQPMFDRLRKEKHDFINCMKVFNGNLEEKSLDLSSTDRDWLVKNVNFVFHCAAIVKFNEPLEVATKTNIRGTENLLALATEMKNLKGFVHVSTAYSHCPQNEIKEKFYSIPITTEDLKNGSVLDESKLNVIKKWPNTYSFTKAITENLILTNENLFPISIFRPSIIGCTKSEPTPGWMEGMNGPPGIVTGMITGILRTFPISTEKISDIVPADYTANALISVMWDTANRYQDLNQINGEPKIYNYVSSVESPLSWGRFIEEIHNNYRVAPPMRSIWYIFHILYTNLWVGKMLRIFLHRIPAVLMDIILFVRGKKTKMLKMYSKIEHMTDALYPFTTNQWKFDNRNTIELWSSLSEEDRNVFPFGFEDFDWKSYIQIYYYGMRKNILREDPINMESALKKNRKLFWLHQSCIFLIIYLLFEIFCMFVLLFFKQTHQHNSTNYFVLPIFKTLFFLFFFN